MMCKFLTYSLTLLTIVAGLFVVSACQKEEVSKNEVMLTFNTRSDVADAKSDATTDVESMQELRVIMVNQDGTIIGNQNKPIATDQTQETFNFQAPVKNGNESFTFFAIANESSIVPDNLSWIKQSTGTLFANSINERKTTQIGNDAVFDFSKHIPQTKIWEVSYSEIKESGGNLSITKQLEYITGKISVHFVNQTDEQQTISNIRILGITPNTKGYLFAQNSNDYVQSDLTGDNVNVIHFDVMDDASDDVTLSAPSNENASPSDSVEYYTYPIDAANIASVTFNGNTYSHPILVANWKGKDHIIELTDVTSLVRNQHLKIKVTLINGEMQVNYNIVDWKTGNVTIGSIAPTLPENGYYVEDWFADNNINIGGSSGNMWNVGTGNDILGEEIQTDWEETKIYQDGNDRLELDLPNSVTELKGCIVLMYFKCHNDNNATATFGDTFEFDVFVKNSSDIILSKENSDGKPFIWDKNHNVEGKESYIRALTIDDSIISKIGTNGGANNKLVLQTQVLETTENKAVQIKISLLKLIRPLAN